MVPAIKNTDIQKKARDYTIHWSYLFLSSSVYSWELGPFTVYPICLRGLRDKPSSLLLALSKETNFQTSIAGYPDVFICFYQAVLLSTIMLHQQKTWNWGAPTSENLEAGRTEIVKCMRNVAFRICSFQSTTLINAALCTNTTVQ